MRGVTYASRDYLARQGDIHVHIEEMLHRITKAAAKA
jgi:hypothetical protein